MNPRGNPALAQYRFRKGQSGNPGGVPKGIKHFAMLRIVAEALDKATQEEEVIEAFRQGLKKPARLLACLEFAAKLNRELPSQHALLNLEGEGEVRVAGGRWPLAGTATGTANRVLSCLSDMSMTISRSDSARQRAHLGRWTA